MNLRTYNGCSTIPIYNFYKILDTGDYRYLIRGYEIDEDDEYEIPFELVPKLMELSQDIFYEYATLKNNRKLFQSYKTKIEIELQEFWIETAEKILELFSLTSRIEFLLLFEDLDIRINQKSNINKQVKDIIKRIKGKRNKVRILKASYKKKYQTDSKKVKGDIDREIVALEIGLGIGYAINQKTTTMSKLIMLTEAHRNKIKAYDKNKKN